MTGALLAAGEAVARRGANEPWIALEQHQVHSRIADLVMARINLDGLQQRLDGSWLRALNESELRALRSLRPDRGTSLTTLAARMRAPEDRARRVVSRLVTDSFVDKTMTGSYARVAPVRPIVDRVISFEAKRSDASGAFLQARAHGLFADRCYVACDAAYAHRFDATRARYRAEGIGLVELSASDDTFQVRWPAGRSPLWHVLGLALSAERTLARLLGVAARPLPETRLPGAVVATDCREKPRLLGRLPNVTRHLLRGLGSPALDY